MLSSQSGELGFPAQAHVDVEAESPSQDHESTVTDLLNEAPTSKFHRRTVIISGVGFFTDAYDLFVIGTAAALVAVQWHLSTLQTSWVTGAAILGAFVGAFTFGRIADVIGRKKVYVTVAVIMIFGAVASAFAPDFLFLVIARLVLGLGIGGDYPVSARLHERILQPPRSRSPGRPGLLHAGLRADRWAAHRSHSPFLRPR